MKVVRFDKAESYEPEKDWKRVSLCNEADISVEHFVKPVAVRHSGRGAVSGIRGTAPIVWERLASIGVRGLH